VSAALAVVAAERVRRASNHLTRRWWSTTLIMAPTMFVGLGVVGCVAFAIGSGLVRSVGATLLVGGLVGIPLSALWVLAGAGLGLRRPP
jgi:hypothetical protein